MKATPVERFRCGRRLGWLRAAGWAGEHGCSRRRAVLLATIPATIPAACSGPPALPPTPAHPPSHPPARPPYPPSRKAAKALVEAVERNSAWVGRARDAVDFSPKDLAQVAAFLGPEAAARQVREWVAAPAMATPLRGRTPRRGGQHAARPSPRRRSLHSSSPALLAHHSAPFPTHLPPLQAPIQQFSQTLTDRARQRLAMRLTDEVAVGAGPAAAAADDRCGLQPRQGRRAPRAVRPRS